MENRLSAGIIVSLILLVLSVGIYIKTLGFGWVLDDSIVIENNAYVARGFYGIGDILTHDTFAGYRTLEGKDNFSQGGRYRPLSLVLFACMYEVFGLNPFFYHLLNVVLYAIIGYLLYGLCVVVLKDQKHVHTLSFFIAAIFIAHPLHTEVVANVKGLDEILASIFVLLSLRFVISRNSRFWLSGVFALLACFAKEYSVMLVLIAPITIYFIESSFNWKKWLPVLTGCLIYLIVRIVVVKSGSAPVMEVLNNPFIEWNGNTWVAMDIIARYGIVFQAIGLGLCLFILPLELSYDYSPFALSANGWGTIDAWIGTMASAAAVIYCVFSLKKKSFPAYGLIWYFVFLLPASNLLFNVGTPFAERFLFLPSAGLIIALVGFIYNSKIKDPNRVVSIFSIPVILVLGFLSFQRTGVWKSNTTLLYSESNNRGSENIKWNADMGIHLLDSALLLKEPGVQKAYLQRSSMHLKKAVQMHPTHYNALLALGASSYYNGDYSASVNAYRQAFRIYPADSKSRIGLIYALRGEAQFLADKDQIAEASLRLQEGYLLQPDTLSAMTAYRIFRDAGEPDSAQTWLNKALNLQGLEPSGSPER